MKFKRTMKGNFLIIALIITGIFGVILSGMQSISDNVFTGYKDSGTMNIFIDEDFSSLKEILFGDNNFENKINIKDENIVPVYDDGTTKIDRESFEINLKKTGSGEVVGYSLTSTYLINNEYRITKNSILLSDEPGVILDGCIVDDDASIIGFCQIF